jgi:hypothetical protein
MNYRRPSVNVVRGQCRVSQRREERAHLSGGKLLARLDRRLACDSRGQPLVLCRSTGHSISGQCIERLSETTLGVEARMGHRHGVDDQRVSAKSLHLESQPLQVFAIGVERLALGRPEMESQWEKQPLRGGGTALERVHELLVQHALVRRVLVDENEAILVLERDVGPSELDERRNWCSGCGNFPHLAIGERARCLRVIRR